MRRRILQVLAIPIFLAASVWFCASPAWSVSQFGALLLVALSMGLALGGLGAFFAVTGLVAMQGSDPHGGNGFVQAFLPLVAILSLGGLLASAVLRNPGLGKKIESDGSY